MNKIKDFLKKIFGLSSNESNGAFVLIILLFMTLFAKYKYIKYRESKIKNITIENAKI